MLAGLESIARNHRLALTEPPRYDIYLENYKGTTKKPVGRPLLIWSKGNTFQDFLQLATESKPIVFECEAQTMDKDLEMSFEVYIPKDADVTIKTTKGKYDPAPLARSRKGLKSTGKLDVTLPNHSMAATVYVYFAIIGQTMVFGCVRHPEGTYVPELEGSTAKDIFENGVLSGRLKKKYRDQGLLYMDVGSAALPVAERGKEEKQKVPKRKRTGSPSRQKIIEISDNCDDDDEQDDIVESTDEEPRRRNESGVRLIVPYPPEACALTLHSLSDVDATPSPSPIQTWLSTNRELYLPCHKPLNTPPMITQTRKSA